MGTNETNPDARAIDGSRVALTGGAGFIGSRLAARLLDLGADVAIIDDLSSSSLDPIASLLDLHPGRLNFIHASILEPAALDEALAAASTVFHLAAVSAAPLSLDEPTRVFDVNAAGTQRVCEAARRAGAARLVYAASCSAYGDQPAPHREDLSPSPLSPYAASKIAGEAVVAAYHASMHLPAVSLRFFNVFGPGQPADSPYAAVIPTFIERALRGLPIELHAAGAQTRDFVHVTDVVRALLLAASKPARHGPYNIGSGAPVTIRHLAETITRLAGPTGTRLADAPARKGDVPNSAADTSRAAKDLGFTSSVPLEDALAELVELARRQPEPDAAPSAD